jgi:hypothetical protein
MTSSAAIDNLENSQRIIAIFGELPVASESAETIRAAAPTFCHHSREIVPAKAGQQGDAPDASGGNPLRFVPANRGPS